MLKLKSNPKLESLGEKCERKYFLKREGQRFRPEHRSPGRKMLELWKKQLTLESFYVKHENPSIFITSQWQRKPGPNLYYLIYRWLITIFFVISLAFSIADLQHLEYSASERAKWLIYLTSWGFTTCTLQTLLGAVMISSCFLTARKRDTGSTAAENNQALILYKIYWITNIVATDIAFGITIIYWSLIYDELTMALDEMNIIVHIINSVMMLIDLSIVAHPIRLLHVYWPVLYGLCYIVFSIIYYVAGGTNKDGKTCIYQILDWSKPGMTILICVLVTLFIIVLHCLTYGIYYLRKTIHGRLIGKTEETKKEENGKEVYNNPVLSNDVV